jgi:hypothetical protein
MEERERTYKILRYAFYESRKHSLILTASFIVVFAIARVLGFAAITEIRFVNYMIAFFVSYDAIKKVYIKNAHKVEYFTGLLIGVATVIMGQFMYSVLFFIYLKIDHAFMIELLRQIPRNIVSPEFSTAVLLFLEGFGLSPIISLALMQYFKSTQGRWAHTTGE